MKYSTILVSSVLLLLTVPTGVGAAEEESSGFTVAGGRIGIAAIPIPSYNESLGWSIGFMLSGFYRVDSSDTISPQSSTTLFGFYTENKSSALGFAQRLFLREDTWRITVAMADADINFQFFAELPDWIGGGTFVDYATSVRGGVCAVSRKTIDDLYAGLKYIYKRTETEFDVGLPLEATATVHQGIAPLLSYDTRDNIFYPGDGLLLEGEGQLFREALGGDGNYEVYAISANAYRELRERHVLAARIHARIAAGDVPFEAQSIIIGADLRGYTDGRYRADQRYTIQAEYRWNFYRRFSAVAFGGIGWSVDAPSDIGFGDILPSAGAGIRFRMISDPPVNIGVDFAAGKDETAFYFRILEAF